MVTVVSRWLFTERSDESDFITVICGRLYIIVSGFCHTIMDAISRYTSSDDSSLEGSPCNSDNEDSLDEPTFKTCVSIENLCSENTIRDRSLFIWGGGKKSRGGNLRAPKRTRDTIPTDIVFDDEDDEIQIVWVGNKQENDLLKSPIKKKDKRDESEILCADNSEELDCKSELSHLSMSDQVDYYENNKETPYFKKDCHVPFSNKEAITALLCDNPMPCSKVPMEVMENSSFIIDLDKLVNPKDILSDDLGKWIHVGSPKSYVERDSNGEFLTSRKTNFEAEFILTVREYIHFLTWMEGNTTWHYCNTTMKVEK
ncbi:hypothetical protein AC249_AIPGENE27466 [Exaiptasia diaphana]|nr:hypothetical protein AC249_AIPGENE27466 [Exaiptasia diaphana]